MQEKKSEPVTVQLYFFPSSLVFLIVVEWFLIVIACFSKAKAKQTFTKSKIDVDVCNLKSKGLI